VSLAGGETLPLFSQPMDIEIIGFDVINGSYAFHDLDKAEIVHSPEELIQRELDLQLQYDQKEPGAYKVQAIYRAELKVSEQI